MKESSYIILVSKRESFKSPVGELVIVEKIVLIERGFIFTPFKSIFILEFQGVHESLLVALKFLS